MPISRRNATKEDDTIAANQSQPLGPSTGAMGTSEGKGLNHMVRMLFGASSVEDFSLVTKASIRSSKPERSEIFPDSGRRRSSMVRSAEVLKAQMRRTAGVGRFRVVLWWMSSRIMEMKGVIPLPPLTSISESYL
ncbi:hypothetical protein BHM03_00054633 [Ensete ventricosum]|uniref:Uncharacterized protein n=1 Tax=Ensete ventricosum TaxID=4639 RepID=A0A426XKZ5_ENSVE|nr:hypothetical protein B296_00055892 [Ensete ventricosum]RZR75321.1 hypothetical protein BHM03_00054633 [Ensete ventricosum]